MLSRVAIDREGAMRARLTFILCLLFVALWGCREDGDQLAKPVAAAMASLPSDEQVTSYAFSSAGSRSADGSALTYRWDFGDGSTSEQPNPTHRYARSGSYRVILKVTDRTGGTATADAFVQIEGNALSLPVNASASTVNLNDIATLAIPAGTFSGPVELGFWTTVSGQTRADFNVSSILYTEPERDRSEFRINVGAGQVLKPIGVSVTVPAEIRALFGSGYEPKVFVQILESEGEEVLDHFQIVAADFDPATNRMAFELLPSYLTNLRSSDGSWEAIFIVGGTRTAPGAASLASSQVRPFGGYESPQRAPSDALFIAQMPRNFAPQAAGTPCGGASLSPPLETLEVTSPFSAGSHHGTDYRAADGTSVRSMTGGTVIKVGYQVKQLTQPHPRSGKMVSGWGHYVVVRTADNSTVLYAHLQEGQIGVAQGDTVAPGSFIARSNNSGGSSGPHLHVEYTPYAGTYANNGAKVDPHACIGNEATGGIAVRDNGNLADDAFTIFINSREVCRTSIGASNNCIVGSLRRGSATLAIRADIAPDNVGTYQITLSQGLTFADGTTSRSSTVAQGGTHQYTINVP